MLHLSRKIRLAVAVVAVLILLGMPARHLSHFYLRHSVHARTIADVVSWPSAFSPLATAGVVLPALLRPSFFRPASAGLDHDLSAPLFPLITRPPPRFN